MNQANMMRAGAGLMSGSVLGQLAMLASTILVARWISPAQYGLFGAVLGGSLLLNACNTLAVELRIPVVTRPTLDVLLRVGIAAALVVSAAVLCVGLILTAADVLGSAGPVLCAVAPCAALAALQLFIVALHTREQRYGMVARIRLVQAGSNAAAMLAFAAAFHGWESLAGAWALSMLLAVVTGLGSTGHSLRPRIPSRLDLRTVREEVGPAPLTQLLSGVSSQVVLVALPVLAGKSVAGEWALVSRVFGAAITTVSTTVQPLYAGRAASHIRSADIPALRRWHHKVALRVLAVTLPGFIIGAALLAVVVPHLSSSWGSIILVLPAAVVAYTAQAVVAPLSGTLMLMGRAVVDLKWEIVRVVGAVGSLFAGATVSGLVAVDLWAATTALLYAGLIVVHGRQFAVAAARQDLHKRFIAK